MERHHQHGLRVVILALGTAIGLLGGAQGLAADPDFTSVTDVLGGKRQLLRVDDLAVLADTHPNPNLQETDVLVLQTDGAKIVKTLPPASVGGADGPYSPTSRIAMGRVFNLANDVVATAVGSGNASSQVLYVFLRDTVSGDDYIWLLNNAIIPQPEFKAIILADFNQDGYADVLTAYGPPFDAGGTNPLTLRIMAGQSDGTPTETPQRGAEASWPSFIFDNHAIAVGDFNGDGLPEIVTVFMDASGPRLAFGSIDPKTLNITIKSMLTLPLGGDDIALVSIAAGRYDDDVKDGLVVAYAPIDASAVKAVVLKFDATLQNIEAHASTAVGPGFRTLVGRVIAKSAKLNWFGAATEQVVIAAAGSPGLEGSVWIYSFNQDLQFLQDVAKFPVAPADGQLGRPGDRQFRHNGRARSALRHALSVRRRHGVVCREYFYDKPSAELCADAHRYLPTQAQQCARE